MEPKTIQKKLDEGRQYRSFDVTRFDRRTEDSGEKRDFQCYADTVKKHCPTVVSYKAFFEGFGNVNAPGGNRCPNVIEPFDDLIQLITSF